MPSLSQYDISLLIYFVLLFTISSKEASFSPPTKSADSNPPYTKMQFMFS